MEQINMFDFMESIKEEKKAVKKVEKPAKLVPEKNKKKTVPKVLTEVKINLFKLFASLGLKGFSDKYNFYKMSNETSIDMTSRYRFNGNTNQFISVKTKVIRDEHGDRHTVIEFPLKYIDADNTLWYSIVNIQITVGQTQYTYAYAYAYECDYTYNAGPWKEANNILDQGLYVSTKKPMDALNQYQKDWLKNEGYYYQNPATVLFEAPYLEVLCKAGYRFAEDYVDGSNTSFDVLRRLCNKETTPKKIFKTSKAVYTALKDYRDMSQWDLYRKMDKFGRIKESEVADCVALNFDKRDLELISSILGQNYQGHPVFTFQTLMNYLQRLNTFEALEGKEALMILFDYLNMCHQLDMKPKIDGDSLKREHDISARLVREHRNEIMKKEMQQGCDALQKYNYAEKLYMVRGIRDYDDLIDEAKQQHNCVASYSNRIANGSSLIFVLREVNLPNKSVVTIELSPNLEMRQKYMAYNQPIRNKSISDFIDRWLKTIRSKKNLKKTA